MITDPKTIPVGSPRPLGLRRRSRSARDGAHRAADHRVRDQGGDPRLALRGLRHPRRAHACGLRTACAPGRPATTTSGDRRRCARGLGRLRRTRRGSGHPGPTRGDRGERGGRPTSGDRRRRDEGRCADRRELGADDRAKPPRRSADRVGRIATPRPRATRGRGERCRGSRRSGRRSVRRLLERPSQATTSIAWC